MFVLPPVPLEGQLLTLTLAAPEDGDVSLDLLDGQRATVTSILTAKAGSSTTSQLFIAPVGPQPLHLAVRIADTKGRAVGLKHRYSLIFRTDQLGPSLLKPPVIK